MSKKNRKTYLQNKQFLELRHQYQLLGTSIFEWKGLDELDIPIYEPENTLYNQGQACMLQVPGTDSYAILPVAYGSEKLDIYGRPTEWSAYCVGDTPIADKIRNTRLSYIGTPNTAPSVLIWNDYTRTPTRPYIDTILTKMCNVDIALEANINVQKTPFILNCNMQNQLTAKNYIQQIQEGMEIFKSSEMDDMSVDVINLGVNFIGAELSDQYKTFENRILEYLGIDNLPVEKQERMLTGEVSSNDDKTNLMFEARMLMRERACTEMNELFGLNIEVQKRELPQPTQGLLGTQDVNGEGGSYGAEDGESREKA